MVVSLPAAPAQQGAAADEPARPPGTRERGDQPRAPPAGRVVNRVLVVDDEPQILRALAINLRARHYEVFTAATGTDALATAASHPPDLVILDLGLPDIDGVEVIRGLRGWTHGPHRRPLRTHRQRRQGRRARRRRRRLPHQAVRGRRADGADARRRAAGHAGRRTAGRDVRADAPSTWPRGGSRVRDGDQVVDVRLTPTEWHLLEVLLRHPGKLLSPAPAAHRGVGTGLRDRRREPARLHGPAAPQARGRPGATAPPAHRARHGLPLPARCQRTLAAA